jgi:isopenicillin N synthase-like dioxygenase
MASTSFPVISFQEFLTGSEVEKKLVAQKLYNAFHTFGWVYLQDFGISADEIDEMFAIVISSFPHHQCSGTHTLQSKKYFDRPLEEKLKQTLSSAEVNQGYTPDGAEANGGTDHKEVDLQASIAFISDTSQCYEHRRFKNELCPTETEFAGFHRFMDSFYQVQLPELSQFLD